MRPTARRRVLDYVLRRPGASPAQIGRALSLSPATVRHHIRILCNDDRIVSGGVSRTRGRGRPPELYWPGDKLLGDNLRLISDSLLRAWPRSGRGAGPRDPVAPLAEGLLQEIGPVPDDGTLARRLAGLVDALGNAHYHARWEAGAEGPRIIFGHCPYAAIIEDHPELCQMDQAALAKYMRADVTQLTKIDVRRHSVNQCVFAMHHAGLESAERHQIPTAESGVKSAGSKPEPAPIDKAG
jgi:predicted ArsR family transcriptional regulator